MSIRVSRPGTKNVVISSTPKPSVTVKAETQDIVVTGNLVAGPPGPGVAPGGNPGDLLVKSSATDYDTEWVDYKTTRHTHAQSSATSEWSIHHTLGGRPAVTIVDSSGTSVFGEVRYLSDSDVVISFSAPFSGYAYLT